MTPGQSRPRTRLALLLAVPLALCFAGRIAGDHAADRNPADTELHLKRQALHFQADFRFLLEQAQHVATTALNGSPESATRGATGALAKRLEGVGRMGANGAFEDWEGTPVEPAPFDGRPDPSWSVRVEGLWTRLVVRVGPDGSGRSALASFVLDGPHAEQRFVELLPHGTDRDTLVRVEFVETEAADEEVRRLLGERSGVFQRGSRSVFSAPLTSPRGDVLVMATLQEIPAAQNASFWRGLGEALGAIAFALLLAWITDGKTLSRTGRGWLATTAGVVIARSALLFARVPSRLLPRDLGSPTLYGSPEALGLLASPADLLLTSVAVLLLCAALKVYLRGLVSRRRGWVFVASLAAAGAATLFVGALSVLLARDARGPLLRLGSVTHSAGQAALLIGLALAILAASELWALASISLRGGVKDPSLRWRTAVALVPLAALSSLTVQSTSDRLALDRLRSEFAPQVLEQAAGRRVALASTLNEVAAADRAAEAVLAPEEPTDRYAAYLLWASADLFHSGYQSSLDLYDANGVRRSHFGFNLPPFTEAVPGVGGGGDAVVPRAEAFPEGAIQLQVLHAEAPILKEGRRVGTAVGHVLNEPENLPFLPGSRPYLSALGFGAPRGIPEDPSGAPVYVLYARDGSVILSTLDQPPAPAATLWEAAGRGRTVRVAAGGERYVGLPLTDGSRLHLLLLPALTLLDRLGAFLRLCLLGLFLLLFVALLGMGVRPRTLLFLAHTVRESFYRKLLASLLVASVLPVLGLSLFVREYVERRAQASLVESATRIATVVKKVVEDYAAAEAPSPSLMNDEILHWLRRVVGQEIHVYEDGLLSATSKRELFSSGLLPSRLPGEAHAKLVGEGTPYVVLDTRLGPGTIPVAYARVHLPGAPTREAVVAVPLILQQHEAARGEERVTEMLLLASVVLTVLLASAAALLARTVARPVRELVAATRRIGSGDYGARLLARTRDEVALLVEGFNAMSAALAAQRADLERRRDYIEALLRNATTGVLSADPEGRIVTLNPAAERLLSGPKGPPRIGEDLAASVARSAGLAPLANTLARGQTEGEPQEVDLELPGKPRRLRVVRVPLPDPAGGPAGSLWLLDDVTELMRSNQLAAWAEMARAIAHEIKNPLTPIQLSAEHLERLLRDRGVLPQPEIEACLETVRKQVRNLREIAAEFSAYAKLPDLVRLPTQPEEFLREVAAPYRAALPLGITLRERYRSAAAISIDRRVLSRAVINLVENALQAMSGHGTLTLAAEDDHESRTVILSVEDTGPGLDPGVRARLFEPYFSTKSSGTGLGLAIVRRAVEAHQGRIEVESAPSGGTVFRILLPAAVEEPSGVIGSASRPSD